jgi:hypothetical protein
MLTLDRKQQPPTLRDRRAARPLLLGGLLFAGLAVVPLSADAPFTGMRVLGLVLLLGLAAVHVALGVPRTRVRPLPARASSFPRLEDRPLRLELSGDVMPPSYRAELVHANGSREVVLERSEPAGVLTDALELASLLEIALLPGWGLDRPALDALVEPSPGARETHFANAPLEVDSPAFAGQKNAAITTLWAAGFVLAATVVMSESARANVTPGALSVALPCIGAFIVLVIGLWILGLRGKVVVGPAGVARQSFWFRWPLGRAAVFEAGIRAATVVTIPGSSEGHLVLATTRGYLAFLVRGTMPQTALLHSPLPSTPDTRAAE